MIERYTLSPLDRIWSETYKFETWKHVEIAAAASKGAPPDVLNALLDSPTPTPEDVAREERLTRHDVAAFLKAWRSPMPPHVAVWVHRDMTSSDLVDTANSCRIREASREISTALRLLVQQGAAHALAFWDTPRLARTHGQAAEGSTWGYRVAGLVEGLRRSGDLFAYTAHEAAVAKLSGPVGTYRYATYQDEIDFAHRLSLTAAGVSTQIVSRDLYADWVYALGRIATCIESIALEIRLSARFGTEELSEPFSLNQVGSTAMPHKRNPILAENLTGLARLVRAQLEPVLEGVASHHERDISHSSVERIALPLASTLTHFMIDRCTRLLRGLVVHDEVMLANLDSAGDVVYSAWAKSVLSETTHPEDAWNRIAHATPSRGELPPQPEMQVDHVRKRMETLSTRGGF